jgi:putative thioredoxin
MDVILDPNQPNAPGGPDPVSDGDQKTFMQDVVEASRQVPVLVDFWATWCGPCKTLTPTLEKVVRASGGRVRLVKIDIDKNRQLVQQLTQIGLPMQSVPTVAAFWQGQIADIFQGALPESEVKKFIENLLKVAGGQMPSADLLGEAKELFENKDFTGALEVYATLAQQEPENAEALAGLARCLLALDEEGQAKEMLDGLDAKLQAHPEISAVRAQIELAEAGRIAQSKFGIFEERLAKDPDDHEARIELAVALNAAEKRVEAAQALLEAIKRDRAWNEEAARKQLLKFFEAWGFDDPATRGARRGLSALLFR